MAIRRSFKSDESFVEKLAIGATGTQAVMNDLRRQGFHPIELERGSSSWKVWKQIKIKRLRVPDILLLDTATRIEARAKTSLQISMSHSESDPHRGWDRGLLDDDFVALTVCTKAGSRPIDWRASPLVQYIRVKDMREAWAAGRVTKERPKGAQEGFESSLTWPSAIAKRSGQVVGVTENRLRYRRESDHKTISLSLRRQRIVLNALVSPGEQVHESQIVASVVPVSQHLPRLPMATKESYLGWLSSRDVSVRYTAAKALAHFDSPDVQTVLLRIQQDDSEHLYVRLEAASGLARLGMQAGWKWISESLNSHYLENQLETVIILGELRTTKATDLLVTTLLDTRRHAEIRSGAAWAIGEIGDVRGLDALVCTFTDLTPGLRVEAVRALRKLMDAQCPDLAARLGTAESEQRAGLAWALSRSGRFTVEELVPVCHGDDEARRWIAYILGTQDADIWATRLQPIQDADPEVFFAATVLWQIMRSWIADVDEF
jgi:hypothetical protein